MPVMCWCLCHRNSVTSVGPVETDDPIEAATACDRCRDRHCAALLSKQLPGDPEPPEPAQFCAPEPWQDAPRDRGEGAE